MYNEKKVNWKKILIIAGAVVAACAAIFGIVMLIRAKMKKDAEIDAQINDEIDAEIERVLAEAAQEA